MLVRSFRRTSIELRMNIAILFRVCLGLPSLMRANAPLYLREEWPAAHPDFSPHSPLLMQNEIRFGTGWPLEELGVTEYFPK